VRVLGNREYFTRTLSSIQQELAAGGYASMVLPGRELEPKYPGFLAANDLYGLINGRFDGLIVNTETLCHNLNPEQTLAFLKQFSLPIVCMGREVVGYPAVALDNTSGMSEPMDHLLEVRGFRRLAFVRGAKGNRDSDEREAVFRDALARRGLELLWPGPYHRRATPGGRGQRGCPAHDEAARGG
jgi:DNA-binding LacI/PurR family transcriptional regulator